jgi:hypothetical protein
MKFLSENKNLKLGIIGIPLLVVASIFYYLYSDYQPLIQPIESIVVVFDADVPAHAPFVYITDSAEVGHDFYEPFLSEKTNDSTITIALKRKVKLRQFRLYFHDSIANATIKEIRLHSDENEFVMNLKEFEHSKTIRVVEKTKTKLAFSISAGQDDTFFESPKFYYSTDYLRLSIAVVIIAFFSFVSISFIVSKNLLPFQSLTLAEWGVFVFIISIFLPQRIFNIALAVSVVLVLRNFNIRYLLNNKINLIFLGFFAIILFNFLFVNPDYKFTSIQKYLMFLVLPIYTSCIRSKKSIHFFWVSALLLGGALLAVALIDFSIFRNLQILSFFNFTRSIHPVYYSYLLAFSIVFLELNVKSKSRYVVHFALGILLILSGSKLVIFLTLLWFLFYVRRKIALVAVGVMLLALFVFAPTKERYESLFSASDLKVISENHIDDPRDTRLNGLTLRFVLWQESLKFGRITDLLFGNGVSSNGPKPLVENLTKRGLTDHLDYNAHNQYITTLYKTGILGFVALIALIVYCLRQSLITHNRMLLFFILLMSFAMLSESTFERVFGIAFFGIVILMLSQPVSQEQNDLRS